MATYVSTTELYTNYVLVITDVGEECDDESALYYLSRAAATICDLFVEVLCVGGKMKQEERLTRCRNCIGLDETDNFKMGSIGAFPRWSHVSQCRMVLQIGPVNDEVGVDAFMSSITPYNYTLLGLIGTTNSFNGAPQHFATKMMEGATSSIIIATKVNGFTTIPLFTARSAEYFPDRIYNEIMRVGFKNTLGRADANWVFLNQLVAPGGANYETAKSITDGIMGVGSFDGLRITRAARKASQSYGSSYNEEQVDGMARMLVAFNRLFGVPVNEVWSSGSPEFSADTLTDVRGTLTFSFQTFIQKMEAYPGIGMTPAYDLVAAWFAIMMCYTPWHFSHFFDRHDDDGIIYAIKPHLCQSTLIDSIMTAVEGQDDDNDNDDNDDDDDDDPMRAAEISGSEYDEDENTLVEDDNELEKDPIGVEQVTMFERWGGDFIE
jgi:hypothetical protein